MHGLEQSVDADGALVRRAQAGDAQAFGLLVERYIRRAYFAALSLVGSARMRWTCPRRRSRGHNRARRTIDPDRPFYAWLYQILRRLCFNFVRDRRSRARQLESAGAWRRQGSCGPRRARPCRSFERNELRRLVAAAMERLPAREREVLALKEFEGLAYREIADLVGVPIGMVMSRLYSARQRLVQVLEAPR
jgi:RNA polymerase sigma-70 factor (ECF subfamily)